MRALKVREVVMSDVLDKWRRPGSVPVSSPAKETGGAAPVSRKGIKLREYKAFVVDTERPAFLCIKPGTVRDNKTDKGFPYACLSEIGADGYGFVLNLTFALPFPGPVIVEIHGEGLQGLTESIMRGAVARVQVFDPEKFLPIPEGHFDVEADEWRGSPLIKSITITDKNSKEETKH
jgi:hypothetical protein